MGGVADIPMDTDVFPLLAGALTVLPLERVRRELYAWIPLQGA
jgi:hypothetical protein